MTMNGGKIYGNRVENPDTTVGSGAIYMNDRANLIMNGGEIYDNTGVCAGAIMSKGVAESATPKSTGSRCWAVRFLTIPSPAPMVEI